MNYIVRFYIPIDKPHHVVHRKGTQPLAFCMRVLHLSAYARSHFSAEDRQIRIFT